MEYSSTEIKKLLKDISSGKVSAKEGFQLLKDLPYQDIGFARINHHRQLRRGFPEVLYCQGKTLPQILDIASVIISRGSVLLATKATKAIYTELKKKYSQAEFNQAAGIISVQNRKPPPKKGLVVVVTAGTSDIPVAQEAIVTARVMGNRVRSLFDLGISGFHRLSAKRHVLAKARVIIVVAGMEGALASVIGGLVACPVIAVPTSVGYGASFGGITALIGMLNSCAPGVVVVNIDNGFGAGYFASLINK
jgi:NCAIR mutase (PurE)-related protein